LALGSVAFGHFMMPAAAQAQAQCNSGSNPAPPPAPVQSNVSNRSFGNTAPSAPYVQATVGVAGCNGGSGFDQSGGDRSQGRRQRERRPRRQ
jgi:hypothetical protein